MRALFAHQNFPGQYKHLARVLAAKSGNEVVFITKRRTVRIPGVRKVLYQPSRKPAKSTHHYVVGLENAVLHGQAVAQTARELKARGFTPDIICAHPGWGESLYLKDIFPDAPLVNFFEFYYRAFGSDLNFDPASPVKLDDALRGRTRNTINLLSLESCDWGVSPTHWQRRQYPAEFQPKISVIHDGIDTRICSPVEDKRFRLDSGLSLSKGEEIVTYVARNLEPYRGFPSFMRAAAIVARRRPQCHFLIVGGDSVSYGRRLPKGETYRQRLLSEIDVDPKRLHFLGRLPYRRYLDCLQVSAVHVYLTFPFVLSWSMLEAMSAGCLVVGSDTPPVAEVIEDGRNGLLADFFSPESIARRIEEVLDHPDRMASVRRRARATVLERYALERCLPRHLALIEKLINGDRPEPPAPPEPPLTPHRASAAAGPNGAQGTVEPS